MLRRLSIRDIVLIDALDLEFSAGLGAMTGETGAGKSILLDALGAALGARAGADLVRKGAASGSATAEFELPDAHPCWSWLKEQGFDLEDEALILRRVINVEGRSRAFINDQPAGVSALRALGKLLIEIHGQFDDRALTDAAGHRGLLDAYGGLEKQAGALRRRHADWRAAEKTLDAARAAVIEAERDAEYVRHSVEELEALAPEAGEEDRLDEERRSMRRAAAIAEDVAKAVSSLGPHGAEGALADALRRLDTAAPRAEGGLDGALAALDRAMNELSETIREVESALEAMAFDPARLDQTEERLFALRGLARKHRIGVEDLAGLRASMAEKLAFIEAGAERIAGLEDEAAQTEAAFRTDAEKLGAARRKAATRLDKAVMKELPPLKLERAVFQTIVAERAEGPTADGLDRVAFEVATNPGAASGPIDKVASGGELSRFLLALKVCLARREDGKTLIFDEIDRGVGGATAAAIGARLKRLGDTEQTLVITHAPQVAARASRHWRIEKSVVKAKGAETTLTRVALLEDAERIDELARMLAGETVTEAARDAAKALLKA